MSANLNHSLQRIKITEFLVRKCYILGLWMYAENKEKSLWGSVWKGLKRAVFFRKKNSFLFSASSSPKKWAIIFS